MLITYLQGINELKKNSAQIVCNQILTYEKHVDVNKQIAFESSIFRKKLFLIVLSNSSTHF